MGQLKEGNLLNGHYRLLQRLGQGGFSVVWLAEDLDAQLVRVAIKVFAPAQGLDEPSLQVFQQEYELTKPLMDTRLLKSTEYFVHDDSPCLVFPFMQGGSLATRINQGQGFTEQEMAKLMYQVGGALDYLHSRSPAAILHLDVKPENILINYAGEYLLADFGISQQLRNTLLRMSQVRGATMHYSPPERIKRQGVGPGADVFAFGVTLLECAGGELFQGNYMPGYAVLSGAPLPPVSVGGPFLEKWLHACLNPDPADRPSALDLAAAADFFIKNKRWPDAPWGVTLQGGGRLTEPFRPPVEPPLSPPPPPIEPGQAPPQRRKRIPSAWVFGSVVGLLMLAFAGYYNYLSIVWEDAIPIGDPVPAEPIETAKPSEERMWAVVKTDGANLRFRERPDTFSTIAGGIPNGENVEILDYVGEIETIHGRRGNWCLIEYNGARGYAFAAYLRKLD